MIEEVSEPVDSGGLNLWIIFLIHSIEFLQDHVTKMESHKVKQQELIEQLKQQLEDLERYAYETGEAGLPQTLIVERQKIIIGLCFELKWTPIHRFLSD